MSPGERERVVQELHDRGCGCGKDDCDVLAGMLVAYDAGASRLAEVEAENERLRGALDELRDFGHEGGAIRRIIDKALRHPQPDGSGGVGE